jgi:hypothetical protein
VTFPSSSGDGNLDARVAELDARLRALEGGQRITYPPFIWSTAQRDADISVGSSSAARSPGLLYTCPIPSIEDPPFASVQDPTDFTLVVETSAPPGATGYIEVIQNDASGTLVYDTTFTSTTTRKRLAGSLADPYDLTPNNSGIRLTVYVSLTSGAGTVQITAASPCRWF